MNKSKSSIQELGMQVLIETIAGLPKSKTARDAHDLVTRTVRLVELELGLEKLSLAQVDDLQLFKKIPFEYGKIIYACYFPQHVLLIGCNGSVELRLISQHQMILGSLILDDPEFIKKSLLRLGHQVGSDSKGVWGTVSPRQIPA